MNQFQLFFLVGIVMGAVYLVKNIRISVSGAQAVVVEPNSASKGDSDRLSEEVERVVESRSLRQPSKVLPENHALLSRQEKLIEFIKTQKLCEFIDYTQREKVSAKEQYVALAATLSGDHFDELYVFNEGRFENFDTYKTVMAKTFLLGKQINAFDSWEFKISNNYEKGLLDEHKIILKRIDVLRAQDPSNIIYAFFRNDIYLRYKNVDPEMKTRLVDDLMATSRYINPVHDVVSKLYDQSKNNIVQFYLSQPIFEKNISIQKILLQRSVWRLFEVGVKEHVHSLLEKALEDVTDSSKIYGYEKGVYQAYRAIAPFELYEQISMYDDYDASKDQPTYNFSELKTDFAKSCDAEEVNDFAIKLRSL